MTKEDKELLIRDLTSRIPYGVNCELGRDNPVELVGVVKEDDGKWYAKFGVTEFDIDYWVPKPYLRPMTSLTKEQIGQIEKFANYTDNVDGLHDTQIGWVNSLNRELYWYLKNHYDCYGLIPKGLALEAPYGMYDNEG